MRIARQELIADLLTLTEASTKKVHRLKQLPADVLNRKESLDKWSALQCIEHLNMYGDFYLPEIEKQLLKHDSSPEAMVFQSGWLGNYFANLMKVNHGKMTKMKSPKDKVPDPSSLGVTTLDRFLKQQERLGKLLHQAERVDLGRVKCSISLTQLIKLRLGDTFRFFVYHIDRHVQQAERAVI